MAKYRINFSGFTFIEADNEEEAKEDFFDNPYGYYQECQVDTVQEVEEFTVHF